MRLRSSLCLLAFYAIALHCAVNTAFLSADDRTFHAEAEPLPFDEWPEEWKRDAVERQEERSKFRLMPGDEDPDQKQLELVKSLVSAVNSNDLGALKSLHHPEAFSCVNDANKEFVSSELERTLSFSIPSDYEVGVLSKEQEFKGRESFKNLIVIPVEPSHTVVIRWAEDSRLKSIYRGMVRNENRWVLTSNCLSEEGLRLQKDTQDNKKAQRS